MRTTAIINLKGGVAKTATTVNLAAILANDYNQRVLIVDADSQANSSEFYGADPDKGNLARVLRHESDGGEFAISNIQPSSFPKVDLLAGDDSLMDLDLTKVELGSVQMLSIREMVGLIRARDLYDWVLIDCPPAFNAASAAALVAADDAIIPIKLDAFSLRGMSNLVHQISNMRQINPDLKLSGLLPTLFYNSKTMRDAEETLRRSVFPVFHHIRRTPKVDDMTFVQQPLIVSSPTSAACRDYRMFVEQLVGGI